MRSARSSHSSVDGQLDPIQQGFHELHALQCGFCTPGMLMTGRALLDENPDPYRARDPHGHLRRDLPVHGLQEHRRRDPLGGRARSRHAAGGLDPDHGDNAEPPQRHVERPIGFGRLKRKEDARFIRGQGNYLDDIRLPGMLHGAILRSPYAHATIVSIDTSQALAHPNVAAVVTAKDLETLGLAWMPTISYDTQAVLAGDKVRFQGQEVAFVIATDEYSARDALTLIDVEYDPLPAVVNARRRSTTTPRSFAMTRRARPTTWPARPGRPATRRPPTAPLRRPTRWSAATSSTRVVTPPRSRRAGSSPTSTPQPGSSTSTTATRRPTPTARSTRT